MEENAILPTRLQNLAEMDVIPLELWSIKFYGTGYKLEGIVRPEDFTSAQKFSSELIIKRITQTALIDASERFIELVGQIDRTFQLRNGMPEEIVNKFQNGFPKNWYELLKPWASQNQKTSTWRAIEAPPVAPPNPQIPPIPQKAPCEPIVTFDDETEVQSDKEKEEARRRRQLEVEEAEKQRKILEDLNDDADYTLRNPRSIDGVQNTPLRFKRGNPNFERNPRVFNDTPVRTGGGPPLAASTPQAPKVSDPIPKAANYASEGDLFSFAVPTQPPSQRPTRTTDEDRKHQADRRRRSESLGGSDDGGGGSGLDLFSQMSEVFSNAKFPITPLPAAPPRSSRFERERAERSDYYREDRDRERYRDPSRESRERDESRMSRKRGYYRSPEGYEYSRRREDRHRDRYESSYQRYGESSSSGRSVRFDDGYDDPYEREEEERRLRRHRDNQKLREIMRREREVEARLERSKRSRRYSSEDDGPEENDDDLADEWDRENREILDNSMSFARGGSGRAGKKRGAGRPKKTSAPKSRSPPTQQKPRKQQQAAKKRRSEPAETDDLNDSIASHRPRRACTTPKAAAPKRVTWPKRDLDKLRRIIEVKKPTGDADDWVEVARLLAKDGVEPADVKTCAETRLKWKEPTRDPEVRQKEEEEEKKRRNGLAARVKQGIRMREELREGYEEDVAPPPTSSSQEPDYEPDDVSADESLLAMGTPLPPPKKKGGTRGSIVVLPVEDSPMVRRSGVAASPKFDASDLAATQRHVQHLSMIQARPGSSMNTSRASKSILGGKNTSISIEQGARRAMKMMNRGRVAIAEEDEDSDSDDSDDDENDVTAEEDEIY